MLLKIKTDISEIDAICTKLEKFCKDNNISDDKSYDIVIITDEMATNVINYAYPDGKEHWFVIEITKDNNIVHICLEDDGIPFDPLQKVDPNLNESLEERPIGGLGIYLVRQLSNTVTYRRENGKNRLDIFIKIDGVENGD